MINGTVVNNGTNYGTQNGVSLGAGLVPYLPRHLAINGFVENNGTNRGTQNGVLIRPFRAW